MTDPNEKIVIRLQDLPERPLRVEMPGNSQRNVNPVAKRTNLLAICGGVFAVLVVVAAGILLRDWLRKPAWLERVAAAADHCVVEIGTSQRSGTGFVVASKHERHLVLTNRHVITEEHGFIFTTEAAVDNCRVVLRSGEERAGRLVALPKDPNVDLAMVLVESPNLQPLGRIRPFQEIRQGERVAAVGHPLGIEFNLTAGIVSAKKEGLWIVTDTNINHGNSGGPLVDESLAVVGVNTLLVDGNIGVALRADIIWKKDDWDYASDISDLLDQIR